MAAALRARALVLAVAFVAFAFASAGTERAGAAGALAYAGCFSNTGSGGLCGDVPGSGAALDRPTDVITSPDGKYVYIKGSDTLTSFLRSPDGKLTYENCHSNDGSRGCTDLPGSNLLLRSGQKIAVSPDGRNLYSLGLSSVLVFARPPGGQLEYKSCIGDNHPVGTGGTCVEVPGNEFVLEYDISVSPDGNNVYLVTSDSVVVFNRDQNGALSYTECLSHDGSEGRCTNVFTYSGGIGDTLNFHPEGHAVSPDGSAVFVGGNGRLTLFNRAPHGRLTYAGCITDTGSRGYCHDLPGKFNNGKDDVRYLGAAMSIAASPNGANVYVASGSSVNTFTRLGGSALILSGCWSHDGSFGFCEDIPPGIPLQGFEEVEVSADGASLYGVGSQVSTLPMFSRRPLDGKLSYAGCYSFDGLNGACEDLPGGEVESPLAGAFALAHSPEANTVYAVGGGVGNGVVTIFNRTFIPNTSIDIGPAEGSTLAEREPEVAFSAKPTGNVRFECALDDSVFRACSSPMLLGPLADGPHRFSVRARTGEDVDSTPATRSFHVRVAPRTFITAGPAEGSTIADRQPRLSFASNKAAASFECSLDKRVFTLCSSPLELGPLADGPHTFRVRSLTKKEGVDPTPAERRFHVLGPSSLREIDITGPTVKLTKAPKRKLRSSRKKTKVRFAFIASEAGARFQCRIDKRPFKPCSAPQRYKLKRGKHRFTVIAIDAANNPGPPASKVFRILRKRAR